MNPHPFLSGNFSPIQDEWELTACSFTGTIPSELWGGQYVRNGSNPSYLRGNERRYHWFDGDGMLNGVWFKRTGIHVEPHFVNKLLATDVLFANKSHGSNILPTITTLISPISHPLFVIFSILKATFLCIKYRISRLSVANTNIIYHHSKALATCESGPFLQVKLPTLETIGWCEYVAMKIGKEMGNLSFFEEWATAHPRVDPITSELVFYGCSFLPPYLRYSVIAAGRTRHLHPPSLLAVSIPIKSPKLMHDFGVSLKHTVILDLPLTMNPWNLLKGNPFVDFNPRSKSRFGIFPRYNPEHIRWFESESCVIFHTANTWSEVVSSNGTESVNMLACRFKTPTFMYNAGNVPAPITMPDEDICHLFYYRFDLSSPSPEPIFAFTLSTIPFELPSVSGLFCMRDARYIYGCTLREGFYGLSLGGLTKIDCLARIDVKRLIERGRNEKMEDNVVDKRSVLEIIKDNQLNPDDPIKIFVFEDYHFGQECTFVPRENPQHEADGYLLTYVFDERQLQPDGMPCKNAVSELWIIDAANMSVVVGKIRLPQRVPYGFHGNFFSEKQILGQQTRVDGPPQSASGGPRTALQICKQAMYFLIIMWRIVCITIWYNVAGWR